MIDEKDYRPGKIVICMVQKVWSDGIAICKNAPIKDQDYMITDLRWVNDDQEWYIKLEGCDGWFPAKFFTPKDEHDLSTQIQEALSAPVPEKQSIIKEHYLDAAGYFLGPCKFSDCVTIDYVREQFLKEL